jgi:hypothetical protein
MMRRLAASLALASALAACHGADDSAVPSHRDNEAKAAIDTMVAANSTEASLKGLPVPQPTAHALAYQLPPGFVGRWGMTKADCDPNSLVVKGLLTITPDRLKFWESKGSVQRIVRHSPYDVTLELAMTGEGQSWTSTTRLTLDAAATQLVRAENSHSYRYQRC